MLFFIFTLHPTLVYLRAATLFGQMPAKYAVAGLMLCRKLGEEAAGRSDTVTEVSADILSLLAPSDSNNSLYGAFVTDNQQAVVYCF